MYCTGIALNRISWLHSKPQKKREEAELVRLEHVRQELELQVPVHCVFVS